MSKILIQNVNGIAKYKDSATGAVTEGNQLSAVEALDVAAIPASTDITAVPGAFADLAAVQTYLSAAVPIIETRLDALETKVNAIITALKNAGIMA